MAESDRLERWELCNHQSVGAFQEGSDVKCIFVAFAAVFDEEPQVKPVESRRAVPAVGGDGEQTRRKERFASVLTPAARFSGRHGPKQPRSRSNWAVVMP